MIRKILLFFTMWTFSSFFVALLIGKQLAQRLASESKPVVNFQTTPPVVRVRSGHVPETDTVDQPFKTQAN
jgi:hypothetical protein